MLPPENIAVIIIKFLYSLNLVCSYPIIIFPTNNSIEDWFCKCFRRSSEKKAYWAQNFSRFCVTLAAMICSIYLASKLDKFLGLIGALLCAPVAITFPAMLHLKHLATSSAQKCFDCVLIVISLCILVFCTS